MERINKITSERIVYVNESGIDRWSKKATVIYGEVSGKRYAESFISAKCGKIPYVIRGYVIPHYRIF